MKSVLNVIGIIIGVWLLGFLLGAIYADYKSPDFSSVSAVQDFIATKHQVRFYSDQSAAKHAPPGKQIAVGLKLKRVVVFPCGAFLYAYGEGFDSVKRINNPAYDPFTRKVRKKGFSSTEWMQIASGLGIGATFSKAGISLQTLTKTNRWYSIAAIVGGVIGFGIGYKMAYHENYDCASATFQKVLNDTEFWKMLLARTDKKPAQIPIGIGK